MAEAVPLPSGAEPPRDSCHDAGQGLRRGRAMNHGYTYTDIVSAAASGETVLGFYSARYSHSTQVQWRERIESGAVLLDGERVREDAPVSAGQRLTYHRPAWVEPSAPLTFDVLYEDEQIIVVDKPSGLPVLPGGGYLQNTLLFLVRQRFGADAPPSPVHRLGRGTSGVVLFARDVEAGRQLTAAFKQRAITKVYRALVQGVGLEPTFTVNLPIGKIEYVPTGVLYAASADGKAAVSECTVLEEDRVSDQTLLDVEIITGRPHQIRIHVAAMGHPLVGDPLYVAGGGVAEVPPGDQPPLPGDVGYHLHARLIGLAHPRTGAPLRVEAPLPFALRRADER